MVALFSFNLIACSEIYEHFCRLLFAKKCQVSVSFEKLVQVLPLRCLSAFNSEMNEPQLANFPLNHS